MEISNISELLLPIKGNRLSELFVDYSKILFPDFISDDPSLALRKIKSFFKASPNTDGSNINGINEVRDLILNFSNDKIYINSFAITAPHTHWLDRKPIIYHYDSNNNNYVIGPHKIDNSKVYVPVSFIFHEKHPLPFEWTDYSININSNELSICFDIIANINNIIFTKKYPIGISIDFFFKKSIFQKQINTVELPIQDIQTSNHDFSYIINRSFFVVKDNEQIREQVAWHPNSSKLLSLSIEEEILLNDIRNLVSLASNESDKAKLITEIELQLLADHDSTTNR